MSPRAWVRVQTPSPPDAAFKRAVAARCDAYIAEVLVPRHLPVIKPQAEYNYAIGLRGAWHGSAYRFLARWRTGTAHTPVEEFEVAWARFQHMAPGRFDIGWFRHTGQWWSVARGLTLDEAMAAMETEGVLQPVV